MAQPAPIRIKTLVVGDGGVGKTTYLRRMRTGEYLTEHIPTMGVEVSPITFTTTKGAVTFTTWDCAGMELFGGLKDGYYIGADVAIVMFDVTNPGSYNNAKGHFARVRAVCPNIPVILCGNKVDSRDRKVLPKNIILHHKLGIQYLDISSKSNYNYEKPFLFLMRALFQDESIQFTETPCAKPLFDHKRAKSLDETLAGLIKEQASRGLTKTASI
jgi:GTP-binding nuclear protein Ran